MNILYDYQAFMPRFGGGIATCFVNLIKNLPNDVSYKIGMLYGDSISLEGMGLVTAEKNYPFITERHFPFKGRLHKLVTKMAPSLTALGNNQRYVRSLLRSGKFDIFHATNLEDYYINDLHNTPLVITIHDMIAEKYGFTDHQIINKKKLINLATHVITVSQNSKNDILNYFHIPDEKISVIYHGSSHKTKRSQDKIINAPYILYIGGRDGYKNFQPMLKELLFFFNNHQEFHLICTGKEFTTFEKSLIKGHEHRIHHFFLKDEEIQGLYRHAFCLVFPSQYEGFGIPILEAYENECPVLLNNASCFPEVAQNAAIYFNIQEKGSFTQALEKLLNFTDIERVDLIQKQKLRLEYFSWEKSALQLKEVYTNILSNRR